MMHNVYYGHELYHHGILKQKWGKRNGPPYPLKQSQKSSAEKKAEGSSDSGGSGSEKKESTPSASEKAKTMTDEELRTATNRQRLENDYTRAMNDKSKLENGTDSSNNNNNNSNSNKDNADKFPENAELRKKVERIQLQNKYNEELHKYNNAQKSKGQKLVQQFMDSTVNGLVNQASKALVNMIVEVFNESEKNTRKSESSKSNSNNQKQNKKS